MDAEQHKESEREKIMPGRRRGIVVGWRGVQYLCHLVQYLVQYLCQPLSKPIWNSQFEISSPNSSNGVGTVILIHFWRLRASFTNSLHKRKPSFGIKIILSGFTKDAQWKICAEKVWTQLLFCAWSYWIWISNCSSNYWHMCNYLTPKKSMSYAYAYYFGLEMDAICC